MDNTNITSLTTWQRRKDMSIARPARDLGVQPPPKHEPERCPRCSFPLADASYGWVKDYTHHSDHTGHHQKYGYCEVPCPTCSGGIVAKQQAQLINDLFGDAHIPWYAHNWTFATYPQTADQYAMQQVKTFLVHNLAGNPYKRGIYLTGKQGLGKTSLAISALQMALHKGYSGVFITTVELFDILRAAIGASQRIAHGDKKYNAHTGDYEYYEDKYEETQGAKLLRLVKSVHWLVLDDLGVECGTKYVIQQLYLILEARRSQGLYTIFTSNRDAKDLELYWRSNEEGVFQDGLRIIDRLGEYCMTVPVGSKNMREKRGS